MTESSIDVLKHVDRLLLDHSTDSFLDLLIEAKKEYFNLTGKVTEEDDEFESRMNCFNDWFLFEFISPKDTRTIIQKYIDDEKSDPDIKRAFQSMSHSLFELVSLSKKQIILKDVLHDKKFTLSKNQDNVALVEEDVFIGRIICYKDEYFLLKGVCTFPDAIRSTLVKQAKKVKKLKNLHEEINFLLNLKKLKTKWIRYGHIETSKIFVFTT